ncbi:MAG: T9SS type A sorting domain-containing protein [Calditrichae bacterium]|nr:T9SS type A sorting domain-containing protein [Calditrichia bacterium]
MHSAKIYSFIILLNLLFAAGLLAGGKVYLVLGSDTAIWDGMDVARYHCYYHPGLYTDPARNTYGVMDPAFRNQLVDSYGQPMKLTWWMMCGSIFTPGSNTNVPYANTITMYLMKKYHGDRIAQYGDELSLHYHTFKWTDYDQDGTFWWNQSLSFEECRDDFDLILAQLLIEEEVFPVSFRSGWHYMDNGWQNYLDELLPYSLHNDWPNQRVDLEEPLDNTYDWSAAPGQFVPYRPSPANYQLPGNGPGWNVRSTHLYTARYRDLIDSIFVRANDGQDQLACLWGHLPEVDFLTNLQIIDSLAHQKAAQYPGVTFRYCTAIEAMQLWRGQIDSIPPALTFEMIDNGDDLYFQVTTDEAIFQTQPFVAVKDIYENYRVLPCQPNGTNQWITSEAVPKAFAARAAVALCDTLGNQSMDFINIRPRELYLDNLDPEYSEVSGSWASVTADVWGTDYRSAAIPAGDSVKVRWYPQIPAETLYNIEFRQPPVSNPAAEVIFRVVESGIGIDTVFFSEALPAGQWSYLTTVSLSAGSNTYLEMVAAASESGLNAAADVVKFSALVRDRDLQPNTEFLNFGEIVVSDTAWQTLTLHNHGIQPLTVNSISTVNQFSGVLSTFPTVIPPMGQFDLAVYFFSDESVPLTDTLVIASDDPVKPEIRIPVAADVQKYFRIVDNEDPSGYVEFGNWFYSNAQAYGPSSRYAPINSNPRPYAAFTATLAKGGIYDIQEIVPTTVNASNYAYYRISVGSSLLDSLYIDQNQGSGDWVTLGRYTLPAEVPIEVRVIDSRQSTVGQVLRADAVKFALVEEVSDITADNESGLPLRFEFLPNYPNPFNPVTTFRYSLAKASPAQLRIYNTLGQEVAVLVDESQPAGSYRVQWDAARMASGIYFARFQAGSFVQTRKVMLLK